MMRVIIADDEIRVCQLICNLVEWESFDMQVVGVAHDGLQVLELIERFDPNLVVTDIRMPSMDGLETIRRVKSAHPDIQFIIISGYRDFEYAQTAIKFGVGDYLLKPLKKDELSATLERMRQRWRMLNDQLSREEVLRFRSENDIEALRSGLFRDVLLADSPTEPTVDGVNQAYHYHFQPGLFQCFTIKMDAIRPHDGNETGLAILKEKLTKRVRDSFKDVCDEVELSFSRSWVYVILNYAADKSNDIKRLFSACMDELTVLRSLFERLEFTIGVGPAETRLDCARRSMVAAVCAARQRLVAATGRVIEGAPEPSLNRSRMLGAFKTQIAAAAELLDAQKAAEAVDRLWDEVQAAPNANGQEVYTLVLEAFEIYHVTLRPYSEELTGGGVQAFEQEVECLGHAGELFAHLKKTVADSILKLYEQRSQAQTLPIRKAKQFINAHYMEPISLEEVSGIVAFNASYFSTLFKKECGLTFLEYLSQLRVEKAKELLRNTQLSIAEVCCSVGYLDVKHFNKTFKRYASVSPLEFRRLYS